MAKKSGFYCACKLSAVTLKYNLLIVPAGNFESGNPFVKNDPLSVAYHQ